MRLLAILLLLSGTLFSQDIIWESMPTPDMSGSAWLELVSDPADVVYFIGRHIYVSVDSAQTWEKIYNDNELGYFWESGLWDNNLTSITTGGDIYQYNKNTGIWETINLSVPASLKYNIVETDKYNALLMEDRVYFQDKIIRVWDSLLVESSWTFPGVLVGDELYRINNQAVEVYNILTGEHNVRFIGSGYLSSIMYKAGILIFTEHISSEVSIHISSDSGFSWETKSMGIGGNQYLIDGDINGQFYKRNEANYYYSKDTCSTWKPLNIAFVEPESYFALNYNVKYALADGFKRYAGHTINPYQGENFVPMHVGNKYLYKSYSWSSMYTHETFYSNEIVKDTLIDGEALYSYGDENYYSYNDDTKMYRRWVGGAYYNLYDFSLHEGAPFVIQYPGGGSMMISVRDENKTFFNTLHYCKGYDIIDSYRKVRYYAEDIGFLWSESIDFTSSSSNRLTEAYIFNEKDQEFVYYTKGYKTNISEHTCDYDSSGMLTVSALFKHNYDSFNDMGTGNAFTDTVELRYYLFAEAGLSETYSIYSTGLKTNEPVVFNIEISDSIFQSCNAFVYQFRTVDQNLLPDHRRFPEEGEYYYYFDNHTGVEDDKNPAQVTDYSLEQNFPNPFNPQTSISFSLPEAGNVELKVYNVLGSEVSCLVNGYRSASRHTVNFDAQNLPSGIYIYSIRTQNFSDSKKMILLK